MTQSIFYIPDGGMATFNGEGLWANMETCNLPSGHAVSLAAAPTPTFCLCYLHTPCLHQREGRLLHGHLSGQGHEVTD